MAGNVFDDDPLAGEGRSRAGADAWTHLHPIDRCVVGIWQTGSGGREQPLAASVEEQDTAADRGVFLFQPQDDRLENTV